MILIIVSLVLCVYLCAFRVRAQACLFYRDEDDAHDRMPCRAVYYTRWGQVDAIARVALDDDANVQCSTTAIYQTKDSASF